MKSLNKIKVNKELLFLLCGSIFILCLCCLLFTYILISGRWGDELSTNVELHLQRYVTEEGSGYGETSTWGKVEISNTLATGFQGKYVIKDDYDTTLEVGSVSLNKGESQTYFFNLGGYFYENINFELFTNDNSLVDKQRFDLTEEVILVDDSFLTNNLEVEFTQQPLDVVESTSLGMLDIPLKLKFTNKSKNVPLLDVNFAPTLENTGVISDYFQRTNLSLAGDDFTLYPGQSTEIDYLVLLERESFATITETSGTYPYDLFTINPAHDFLVSFRIYVSNARDTWMDVQTSKFKFEGLGKGVEPLTSKMEWDFSGIVPTEMTYSPQDTSGWQKQSLANNYYQIMIPTDYSVEAQDECTRFTAPNGVSFAIARVPDQNPFSEFTQNACLDGLDTYQSKCLPSNVDYMHYTFSSAEVPINIDLDEAKYDCETQSYVSRLTSFQPYLFAALPAGATSIADSQQYSFVLLDDYEWDKYSSARDTILTMLSTATFMGD